MEEEDRLLMIDIEKGLKIYESHTNFPALNKRLDILEKQAQDPKFWTQQEQTRIILQEKHLLEKTLASHQELCRHFQDTQTLYTMALEENDSALIKECRGALKAVSRTIQQRQIESLLSQTDDRSPCYLEVHAGAGGIDSQDWAQMLLRMYTRWCEHKKFRVEILAITEGEEAGLRSVVLRVDGLFAYGWLKAEAGIHRLVRISPFDSGKRRHTSFAGISVYPVIPETTMMIQTTDVRVDTYRASGAGGQHVNKTDSAVRLTHLPSGIVVQCQAGRSQHRNKAQAWEMLRARLLQEKRKKKEAQDSQTVKVDMGWGSQIRSYVLHPYRLVKDVRTSHQSPDPDDVLSGNISPFMEAELLRRNREKHEN